MHQAECYRHIYDPDKKAVKQKCDNGPSARPHCEVRRVQKGDMRHGQSCDHDQMRGYGLRLIRGIVDLREQSRRSKHDRAYDHGREYRERNDLVVLVFRLFHLARAQQLSDDDGHRISHGDKYDVEDVADLQEVGAQYAHEHADEHQADKYAEFRPLGDPLQQRHPVHGPETAPPVFERLRKGKL